MQSEKINWAAIILCIVLLIVGAIGGYYAGRGIQGKDYRSALETVATLETRIRDLNESLSGIRESYEGATREVEYLTEKNRESLETISRLRIALNDLLRDNHALADELGKLELELNTIRGDIGGVAGEIGDVIKAVEDD